jgi:hypothetical protein
MVGVIAVICRFDRARLARVLGGDQRKRLFQSRCALPETAASSSVSDQGCAANCRSEIESDLKRRFQRGLSAWFHEIEVVSRGIGWTTCPTVG